MAGKCRLPQKVSIHRGQRHAPHETDHPHHRRQTEAFHRKSVGRQPQQTHFTCCARQGACLASRHVVPTGKPQLLATAPTPCHGEDAFLRSLAHTPRRFFGIVTAVALVPPSALQGAFCTAFIKGCSTYFATGSHHGNQNGASPYFSDPDREKRFAYS